MMKKNDKTNGWTLFLAGYSRQVLITPVLALILLVIFFCFFGFDIGLLWTNLVILAVWLVLVWVTFRRRPDGDFWRNYRWIISPSVLILLFLFNTSWAQSMLSLSRLEKSLVNSTTLDAGLQIHIEYPAQVFFDSATDVEIRIWTAGSFGSIKTKEITIYSDKNLLFAKTTEDGEPIEWKSILSIVLDEDVNTMTLLMRADELLALNSQYAQLILHTTNGKGLDTSKWERLNIEGRRDAQVYNWKKNFLNTGSTIVSLITAIFVGIKQLEEEKKRQKIKQVEQLIASFDVDLSNDISVALNKHLDIIADWDEWDKTLRDQFRDKYSLLFEGDKKLWDTSVGKTLIDIKNDAELCLQVCERIFQSAEEKTISTLKQLQSALLQDEHASLNLLSILKEYPASINTAKIIASTFSLALKLKTIGSGSEFTEQIRSLRAELGFLDTDGFPLQEQFTFYAKPHTSEERLTNWLKARELDYSPFADADSPFYSVPNKSLLMDSVAPGFALPAPNPYNITFEFGNSWDAGAVLFEYCKALQSNIKVKDDVFFVIVAPSITEDYEGVHLRKLYLHALAEQWEWLLAETPTLIYSLKNEQIDLVGRLLRWHDFSPAISIKKISEFTTHLQEKKEDENRISILLKLSEWLTRMSAEDLRVEEINSIMELRPSPAKHTLFLISSIDPNPHVESQISSNLHKKLEAHSGWLRAQNCGFVGFQIGDENQQSVSLVSLINQCNERVKHCAVQSVQLDEQIYALNDLFIQHNKESAEQILARKANGSPGRMVRLGQKLLLQHVEKYSPDDKEDYKYLHIKDLEAL